MTMCFVFGCNHQSLRRTCRMYRFPCKPGLAKKWEKLCRRKDRALKLHGDRICSCHFKNGQKENGPTIFSWSNGKMFDFPDPSKIRRKDYRPLSETERLEEIETLASVDAGQVLDVHKQYLIDHNYMLSYHQLVEENKNLKQEVQTLREKIRLLSTERVLTADDVIDDNRKMPKRKGMCYNRRKWEDKLRKREKRTQDILKRTSVQSEPSDTSYIVYIDNAEEPSEVSGMTAMVALSQCNSGIDVPVDIEETSVNWSGTTEMVGLSQWNSGISVPVESDEISDRVNRPGVTELVALPQWNSGIDVPVDTDETWVNRLGTTEMVVGLSQWNSGTDVPVDIDETADPVSRHLQTHEISDVCFSQHENSLSNQSHEISDVCVTELENSPSQK